MASSSNPILKISLRDGFEQKCGSYVTHEEINARPQCLIRRMAYLVLSLTTQVATPDLTNALYMLN